MMGHHTDSRAAGSPYSGWAIHCARLRLGQVTDGPSRIEDFKFESCNDWLRMTPRVARLITAAASDFKLSVAGACYYNVTGTCPNCVGGAGPETADYKPTIYRYNICCYVSHLRHYIPYYITWQESPTVTAPVSGRDGPFVWMEWIHANLVHLVWAQDCLLDFWNFLRLPAGLLEVQSAVQPAPAPTVNVCFHKVTISHWTETCLGN